MVSEVKAGGVAGAAAVRAHGARAAFLHAFCCRCLAAAGRLDLDDLVPLAAALLRGHPAVKAAVSECAPPTSTVHACNVRCCFVDMDAAYGGCRRSVGCVPD